MSHLTYIKSRDPEGLHEDTKIVFSQLEFINDELEFLDILIKEYTIELISDAYFEKSKGIAATMILNQKEVKELLLKVEKHSRKLEVLIDKTEVPDEMKNYKNEHYQLMFKIIGFNAEVKSLKKEIFNLITNIMKLNKEKKLLC